VKPELKCVCKEWGKNSRMQIKSMTCADNVEHCSQNWVPRMPFLAVKLKNVYGIMKGPALW